MGIVLSLGNSDGPVPGEGGLAFGGIVTLRHRTAPGGGTEPPLAAVDKEATCHSRHALGYPEDGVAVGGGEDTRISAAEPQVAIRVQLQPAIGSDRDRA